MTYREPLSNQVLIFISSVGPGILIGFMYDIIFSFFRAFGNKKTIIIAADLCFSLSATLLSFFYMVVYNSGIMRFNMIAAQLIGAVAFHFTLGKYLSKPVGFIADASAKVIKAMLFPILFIFKNARQYIAKVRDKLKVKIKPKEKKESIKKKIINILKIVDLSMM